MLQINEPANIRGQSRNPFSQPKPKRNIIAAYNNGDKTAVVAIGECGYNVHVAVNGWMMSLRIVYQSVEHAKDRAKRMIGLNY